tara:strand:+ start:57 stop:629 length:573 start_codon:yes stop_codon:yes gene_type:complete
MGTIDYGINDLINTPLWGLIQEKLNSVDLEWKDGTVGSIEGRSNNVRKSKVSFLNDTYLRNQLSYSVNLYNNQHWKYDLNYCDPIQYAIYSDGGHYEWHVDEEKETPIIGGKLLARKLSMTIWLSDPDEYEGGELDIEIEGPHTNLRYNTLKLSKGSIVIFRSRLWHRVRPVTAGVRKSLVTWFRGAPFR